MFNKKKKYVLHRSKYSNQEQKELYEILGSWFQTSEYSSSTNCAIAIEYYVDKLWEAGYRKQRG